MSVIGVDVGGTKLALARFSEAGDVLSREVVELEGRGGREVGALIAEGVRALAGAAGDSPVRAVGAVVPGIYRADTGRVWAPNLSGWDDYPLLDELRAAVGPGVEVRVDSDRAAYVLGEVWRGVARGCTDVIFLAVGTGIGAGILADGRVLRGGHDVAGAIGWLALDRPYRSGYESFGCFEYQASGPGLIRVARELIAADPGYAGPLGAAAAGELTPRDVFAAHRAGDPIAARVLDNAIELWGMAVANLVSLFDPQMVVLGGGVFGPAARFLDRIRTEALRWGQPISTPRVRLEASRLGGEAGLYGAGYLALRALRSSTDRPD